MVLELLELLVGGCQLRASRANLTFHAKQKHSDIFITLAFIVLF
jgi:hypothetical protein